MPFGGSSLVGNVVAELPPEPVAQVGVEVVEAVVVVHHVDAAAGGAGGPGGLSWFF